MERWRITLDEARPKRSNVGEIAISGPRARTSTT
jgi:hypothetical protein